ncbi:hypothetical protein [Hyperthermus butylicus]|uniref:Conserved crenarchaeal protein n=1 Tax=Hyperthermus butylicus (strain DSM 5456 / JCM 9403 / PLM1-5) TaxID=415426 RepID=A2BJX1_HYPBU|nr:hypothetical protein [Hyperthermus butylicus]ABM80282.1 conserved crenarchaeal protein [Hyperthermus butylicus DSM 5456]
MWVRELETILEATRQLLEAIAQGEYCCLHHGLPYVTPGLLANQAFCEMRLELGFLSGEVEAPRKPSDARVLVEAVLQARRLLPRKLVERLALSTPVAALLQNVPVIGRPHAILLAHGRVEAIVIGKITSRPSRLYHSDRVKLYAYAQLLEAAGFRLTPGTKLVLAAAHSPRELAEALKVLENEIKPASLGNSYIHVLAHDPAAEEELLAPLLAYWRGEKPAQPRPGPWCSTCPYRSKCPANMAHQALR